MTDYIPSAYWRSRWLCLLLFAHAALAPTVILGIDLKPVVVHARYPTRDVVVASQVLAPPADSAADASDLLQVAIDKMHGAGGGVIFLTTGRYRLAAPVTIKEGVTLRGDWMPLTEEEGVQGTVLMPVHGRGNADGVPAITMQRGTGLREVTVWYPDQAPTSIVPYPWTIRFSPKVGGNNMTVHNVTIVNPYLGIKVGPEGNELHTVRNVFSTPLKMGLSFDSTTDIGRVTDVTLTPRCWEISGLPNAPTTAVQKAALHTHLLTEAVACDIGRSDWEYVYRLMVDGYAVGLQFRQGKRGTTNAVMFGCEIRNCATAMLLEKLNPTGLAATGCVFEGYKNCIRAPKSLANAVVQFNTCDFGGRPDTAVLLAGKSLFTFQNCRFRDWKRACVEAQAGQLSIVNCDFEQGKNHLVLGRELRRARILSNRFRGAPEIDIVADAADIQISHYPLDFDEPDISPHKQSPVRRPATEKLFVATDFGASPDLQDNTGAFQKVLDAAENAGGGTIYVPAGNFRFEGELLVPTGVELRGIFDVPHHTVSGGSVLMPTAGRGNADGTPFVRLQPGAGLRGLTFWYPEQDLKTFPPYPWTVRSLGPGCWLIDVTMGNSYQGADFWTHPSTGHVIRYLAGCMFDKGLWISKCNGEGWVEDVQMNPHYSWRLHKSIPRVPRGDFWNDLVDFQRRQLDGIIFGHCEKEHVRGTFLYAARDGIAFRDDNGGTNARVIMHGSDTASRAAVLSAVGDRGVEFINAQLVPLGKYVIGGIITEPGFSGKVSFFCSQLWAPGATAVLDGSGSILLQQLTTRSGGLTANAGSFTLENANLAAALNPHVRIGPECNEARITACVSTAGAVNLRNDAGNRCVARANACSYPYPKIWLEKFPPTRGPDGILRKNSAADPLTELILTFDNDDEQVIQDQIAKQGGGIRNMKDASCRIVEADSHSGDGRVLRIEGHPDKGHSFVYFDVIKGPFTIYPDSVLTYRIKPLNEAGRYTAIDAVLSEGKPLRDTAMRSSSGRSAHPGVGRGRVGEWTEIRIQLGNELAGLKIQKLMCAFDSQRAGDFAALFDNVRLESQLSSEMPWEVNPVPAPGRVRVGSSVRLGTKDTVRIRYTLDGTNPNLDSRVYKEPIILDKPGLWEIRCRAERDGTLSEIVNGFLFSAESTRNGKGAKP